MSDLDPRWYVCVLIDEGIVPLVGPYDDVVAAEAGWRSLVGGDGMPKEGWLLVSGEHAEGELVLAAASSVSSPFAGLGAIHD